MTQPGWTHILVRKTTKKKLEIILNEIQKENKDINSQNMCIEYLIEFFWRFRPKLTKNFNFNLKEDEKISKSL